MGGLEGRPTLRGLAWLALGVAVVGAGSVWLAAGSLVAPATRPVGAPPSDLPFEAVTFPSDSGSHLRGWLAAASPERGAVVLLHSVRSDRRAMLDRARFLYRAGFSVLLFDFQAHGESPGQLITLGHLEAHDARAAVAFVRQRRPGAAVGAIGTSLGGAACVLGSSPLPVDALVLEAVYPTIEDAVANRLRLRFGAAGAALAPLLLLQLEARLGVAAAALRPADVIGSRPGPLLVVAGTQDRRTSLAESRRLFERAPGPKRFWAVEGARHQDLHRFAGRQYERTILEFLGEFL
jgi:fermentation-respiration switch protein FrsA (DUF1100 family)